MNAIIDSQIDWAKLHQYKVPIIQLLRTTAWEPQHARADRIEACGTQVSIGRCKACGKAHVLTANYCRDRFCPICQYKLSRKRFRAMALALEHVDMTNRVVLFATLTVRNPTPERFAFTLDAMSDGFVKWCKALDYEGHIEGYARSLEVTYNAKAGTFHPHYHVILVGERKGPYGYLTTEHCTAVWRRSLNLDYDPQCDVRASYSKGGFVDEAGGAILETFKYIIKPDTALAKMPPEDAYYFVTGLSGRRAVSFGGVLRDAMRAVKIEDLATQGQGPNMICECGTQMEVFTLLWSSGEGAYKAYQEALGVKQPDWKSDNLG